MFGTKPTRVTSYVGSWVALQGIPFLGGLTAERSRLWSWNTTNRVSVTPSLCMGACRVRAINHVGVQPHRRCWEAKELGSNHFRTAFLGGGQACYSPSLPVWCKIHIAQELASYCPSKVYDGSSNTTEQVVGKFERPKGEVGEGGEEKGEGGEEQEGGHKEVSCFA